MPECVQRYTEPTGKAQQRHRHPHQRGIDTVLVGEPTGHTRQDAPVGARPELDRLVGLDERFEEIDHDAIFAPRGRATHR
jgi:hypothetical protein